jgi:hypothetical protein
VVSKSNIQSKPPSRVAVTCENIDGKGHAPVDSVHAEKSFKCLREVTGTCCARSCRCLPVSHADCIALRGLKCLPLDEALHGHLSARDLEAGRNRRAPLLWK